MKYCHSRQLRPKTMLSYEQTLKLFFAWIEEQEGITQVEAIRDKHIRSYIIDLQSRGKYTFCAVEGSMNNPQGRRDYQRQVSNGTINNYIRNLRAFFAWLVEEEILKATPMKRIKPLPEERKPREYMENDEVKHLLQSLDKSYFPEYRDYIAVMLMLDSGTRLGETLSIEIIVYRDVAYRFFVIFAVFWIVLFVLRGADCVLASCLQLNNVFADVFLLDVFDFVDLLLLRQPENKQS